MQTARAAVLRARKSGDKIRLRISRGGAEEEIEATLAGRLLPARRPHPRNRPF
jgi:hypothetical protein